MSKIITLKLLEDINTPPSMVKEFVIHFGNEWNVSKESILNIPDNVNFIDWLSKFLLTNENFQKYQEMIKPSQKLLNNSRILGNQIYQDIISNPLKLYEDTIQEELNFGKIGTQKIIDARNYYNNSRIFGIDYYIENVRPVLKLKYKNKFIAFIKCFLNQ